MEKQSFVTLGGDSPRRAGVIAPRSRQNSVPLAFLPADLYPWQWLMKNE
jgi:hypothetical protein